MPGIEKSRIVGLSEEDLDEFTCCICYEIFVDPVVTQCCRQTYCKQCIDEWLQTRNTCPNDRKPLRAVDLGSVPRIVTNLLSNMKVKCDYETNGCKSVVKFTEFENHVKYCDFNPNKLCEKCGFSAIVGQIHDCIENLSNKNKSICIENKKLHDEIRELKLFKQNVLSLCDRPNTSISTITAMPEVLLSARNHVNTYVIEEPANMIDPNWRQICINQCKDAILNYNSYSQIAENLCRKMNELNEITSFNTWQAIVFSIDGGESFVLPKNYFRIRFDKLVIELFTAGDLAAFHSWIVSS